MTLGAAATLPIWLPVGAITAVSLTGCGGGGGGGTSTAIRTPAAPVSSALTVSASNLAPTALTPVVLTVEGLDFSRAFTVTLTIRSGTSVALTPVRVSGATNAVVIAMPLYIDPASGT